MKKKYLIVIVAVVLVLTGLVPLIHSQYRVLDVELIPTHVIVNHKLGFNIDNDLLWFGSLPPGQTSSRNANIKNTYDEPILIRINYLGEMKDWLSASPNNFVLMPNETQKIKIVTRVPDNVSYGNYSGKVRVLYLRK
jgi:hypothetical protein